MTHSKGPASPDASDGVPLPQRYWAVFALSIAVAITALDATLVNVALPQVGRDLDLSSSDVVWVVKAYLLTVMVTLLPMGSLGERLGYLRVYSFGLVLYVVGALVSTLASGLPALITGRVLQGLGGAGIMAMVPAMIRFIYPRDSLGKGIGFNAVVVASGGALGPTIAASILLVADWPWIFAIYVPLGLLALVIGWRTLPEIAPTARSFDGISALLNILAFALLILGLGDLQAQLFGRGTLLLVLSVLTGTVLVRRQLGQTAPLFPVDLLRIPVFSLSIGASLCTFMAFMLTFVALPFYLQDGLGKSAFETGLLITPWPVLTALTAPFAGRMADRYPGGAISSIGLGLFTIGLLTLAFLPEAPATWNIVWRMALSGLGFGLFQAPNNRAIIASAPVHRSGGASSMQAATRLLGQTLGAAAAAMLFALFGNLSLFAPLVTAATLTLSATFLSLWRFRSARVRSPA